MEEIFEQKCLAENFRVKFFWPKIFGRKFLAEYFWPNILLAENSFAENWGDRPFFRYSRPRYIRNSNAFRICVFVPILFSFLELF